VLEVYAVCAVLYRRQSPWQIRHRWKLSLTCFGSLVFDKRLSLVMGQSHLLMSVLLQALVLMILCHC